MILPRYALMTFAVVAMALVVEAAERTAPVDFSRQVRPILVQTCFTCHGPDESHREAGLRLDRREDAIAELESGSIAIVPGQPDESELIRRIESSKAASSG